MIKDNAKLLIQISIIAMFMTLVTLVKNVKINSIYL